MRRELREWRWIDAPATTVAGDPRITAREHHHPGEQSKTSLRLTEDEARALQTFPHAHEFAGTKTKRFLQIGNAVPVTVARAALEHVWAQPAKRKERT
ncbi:MAG: DNA cytosine methyltransferase [Microbacterium gubbeenense]|uniref:DNA cytosine methyltransferase n=1 Tax=Microbacterium gubbeenense TaxID=159896 RepID=UPI003F95543E